jgi:hypothetical protein
MRTAVFRQPGIDVKGPDMGIIKTGTKQALRINFATIGESGPG